MKKIPKDLENKKFSKTNEKRGTKSLMKERQKNIFRNLNLRAEEEMATEVTEEVATTDPAPAAVETTATSIKMILYDPSLILQGHEFIYRERHDNREDTSRHKMKILSTLYPSVLNT